MFFGRLLWAPPGPKGLTFEISEKLDGSSMTVFWTEDEEGAQGRHGASEECHCSPPFEP
jgi:hypothetical protein